MELSLIPLNSTQILNSHSVFLNHRRGQVQKTPVSGGFICGSRRLLFYCASSGRQPAVSHLVRSEELPDWLDPQIGPKPPRKPCRGRRGRRVDPSPEAEYALASLPQSRSPSPQRPGADHVDKHRDVVKFSKNGKQVKGGPYIHQKKCVESVARTGDKAVLAHEGRWTRSSSRRTQPSPSHLMGLSSRPRRLLPHPSRPPSSTRARRPRSISTSVVSSTSSPAAE